MMGYTEMTGDEYDRAVTRRLWRRRARAVGEAVGATLTLLLFALAAWLFLAATPDQRSAEADWFDAACQRTGVAR